MVADTVTTPIEQEINGVENMLYLSSNSSGDGRFSIQVTFDIGTNLDIAQVQVQNRVSIAQPRLPADVRNIGVTVAKSSPDLMMVVHMVSPDGSRDQQYISNYATLYVKDVLTRVEGVGNVLVFLPQILLLFLMLGLLEDSGYLARVAYLMDRVMRAVGLHGRAFVPMLSGFSCAIPAILATRTMESRRDRLLTMMVIPLMTCSARLPVYTLVIGALFPPSKVFGVMPVQGLLMVAMYVFSTATALAAAAERHRAASAHRRISPACSLRARPTSISYTCRSNRRAAHSKACSATI